LFTGLAVLSADYLTAPVKEIGKIRSVLTMVGGEVVYAGPKFGVRRAPLTSAVRSEVSTKLGWRSPIGGRPFHCLFQIIETILANPFVASASRVIVACGKTFTLNARTIKFCEFRPTAGAVIVVPAFAPTRVPA
jgi:hypothetical protein